jgi:hypothetical protein
MPFFLYEFIKIVFAGIRKNRRKKYQAFKDDFIKKSLYIHVLKNVSISH